MTCRGYVIQLLNLLEIIVKQILCIRLVNYEDKDTEIHGQQNIKKRIMML